MTRIQYNLLRHALGLHESDTITRNHWYSTKDSPCEDCQALAEAGLIEGGEKRAGGFVYWHVTDIGVEVALSEYVN